MNKKQLLDTFSNPGNEYRGKPFWSWNGELEADELIRQANVMKEMGLGGYFMHSRTGLITEYLGDEWFDLINAVTDESERIGMEAWLYDEDRWPSGSAGGKVTVDEQYRIKSIELFEMSLEHYKAHKDEFDRVLEIFTGKPDGYTLTDYKKVSAEELDVVDSLADGYKVLLFKVSNERPNNNYNGNTYIDTMSYAATERFIEMTHEKYKEKCGDRLGTTIKGIFTDEPHRGHLLDNLSDADGVRQCKTAYTDDIFQEFEKRYGYDLRPILPEIFYHIDGKRFSRARLNYVDLADNLFLERFAKPLNDWCIANNIDFTGHVLHEDSLTNQTEPQGSLMRFYQYQGVPGVDVLSEYNTCYWIVKQLASASRQLGKKWMLSELYGCTGWQFDFKGQKATGDWQALYGINLRCQHLSWYCMEGESKRDYPGSILHQSTYWQDYSYLETYFARFGLMMMQGDPICDVLVMNPIESIWPQIHIGWARWISLLDSNIAPVEHNYVKLFHILAKNHIDFDYGEEQMMAGMYSISNENGKAVLSVGQAKYKTVVVAGMLTMRPTTAKILKEFMEAGGKVIFAGDVPAYIDAEESTIPAELSQMNNAVNVAFEEDDILSAVRKEITCDIAISSNAVISQNRYDAENNAVYVAMVNTDRKEAVCDIKLTVDIASLPVCGDKLVVEQWDLATGVRYQVPFAIENNILSVDFDMYSAADKFFVITAAYDEYESLPVNVQKIASCDSDAKLDTELLVDYKLSEPNICVLDMCSAKFEDAVFTGESLKVDRQIRAKIGIEARGGEMLQPWFTKLNCKDVYGEVTLDYDFYCDEVPAGPVFLAAERPENFEYSINGIALENKDPKDFWIDITFKKLYIPAGAIVKGRNVITAKVSFMRSTNIESLYLVGDFGVHIDGNKRTLTALPAKVGFKNIINYDLPFYSGKLTYVIPAAAIKAANKDAKVIKIDNFCGSLVKVNGAGCDKSQEVVIGWDPYMANIEKWLKDDKDIEVTLVCSRRNTYGPLHLVPPIQGAYGPGHWVTGGNSWSDDYVLIDSGIFGLSIG